MLFKFNSTDDVQEEDEAKTGDDLDKSGINKSSNNISLNTSSNNINNNNSSGLVNNSNYEMEERKIFEIINSGRNLDFTQIVNLVSKLNDKYDDQKLNQLDEDMQDQIVKALENLKKGEDFNSDNQNLIYDLDKLLNFRIIKELRPSLDDCSWIDDIFQKKKRLNENINEIQTLYTLFYLHPCIFTDLFEVNDDTPNFMLVKDLIRGFQPMFKELNTYSKRCISMDNIVYMNFFNMLIDIFVKKIEIHNKNTTNSMNLTPDNIFDNDTTFFPQFMDVYFYDEFKRCIFFDVFEKALKDLNIIAKNKKTINIKSAGNKSEESIKIVNLLSVLDGGRIQEEKNIKVYLNIKIFLIFLRN